MLLPSSHFHDAIVKHSPRTLKTVVSVRYRCWPGYGDGPSISQGASGKRALRSELCIFMNTRRFMSCCCRMFVGTLIHLC